MIYKILHYEKLVSTNNLANELAREGAAEGLVVWADYQTKGRGRFKRKWKSPKGKDLLFSVLIKPKVKSSQASMVTFLAARAIQNVLKEKFELPATIKKPNDVLVNGKKICGILTEASSSSGDMEYIVVGMGINVNSKARQMLKRATSILELTGKEQDRSALLQIFLAEFRNQYRTFQK